MVAGASLAVANARADLERDAWRARVFDRGRPLAEGGMARALPWGLAMVIVAAAGSRPVTSRSGPLGLVALAIRTKAALAAAGLAGQGTTDRRPGSSAPWELEAVGVRRVRVGCSWPCAADPRPPPRLTDAAIRLVS
jgi:hypothetical protein